MSRTAAGKLAELAALKKRAAELETRIAFHNMPAETLRKYAAVEDRASRVAAAFGDSAAPHWRSGEELIDYRKRLVGQFAKYSPSWSSVDFNKLAGAPHLVENVLCRAEEQVYADALEASRRPESYSPGTLREIKTADPSGRIMSRFVGDFDAAFGMFKRPAIHLRIAKPDFWS